MLTDLQYPQRGYILLISIYSYATYFDVIGIEPTITREIQFSNRKDHFEWSDDAFPPHLREIPDSEKVPLTQVFDAIGLNQTSRLIAKLIPGGEVSNEELGALGIEGNPYSGASISEIEERNRNNLSWRMGRGSDIKSGLNIGDLSDWYSDSRFAQQQFTGTNPNTITSASETWLSRFSHEAEKQQNKNVLELFQKAKAGSFYIQDCSYFRDAIGVKGNHVMESKPEGRFLAATVSLFQLHPDGRLHPVAIVIDYKGSMEDSVTIFNKRLGPSDSAHDQKTDWPWRYAKTCAQVADWVRHEVTVHLVNTHFIEEVIIVATNRHMDSKHPVFRLLQPHWFRTLSLNAGARHTLIPEVVLELIGLEEAQAFKFISHAFKSFDFVGQYVPHDLASRGFPVDKLNEDKFRDYPYARNMKLMWDVLRKFVASMIAIDYPSDAAVVKDDQIKGWYQEIQSQKGGQMSTFPTITTRDQLIDAITMCIHIASPQHTAVNYLQNFYMTFVIAKPSALFEPPPDSLSQLLSYDEKTFIKALPINHQREWLLSAQLPWLLSFRAADENNLLNYAISLWGLYRQKTKTNDKKIGTIAKVFYDELRELIGVFIDHSNQMNDTCIPYTVMDPNTTAVSILI